jgi:acyl-CoA reductase-like NAD-dependent aldehyde dehydrogenase
MRATSSADPRGGLASLDIAVEALRSQEDSWARVPASARISLIDEVARDVAAVADEWAAASAEAVGLDDADPASAEPSLEGPYLVLRYLRLLRRSLVGIERDGVPPIPGGIRSVAGGQVAARVFPVDIWDRLFFAGLTADVWMEPGVAGGDVAASQAVAYRQPDAGGVCLVLGGGNLSSIGPLDALGKLFIENRVVVLKQHPVLDYLRPILQRAFNALVRRDFLRIVGGGAPEGAYLCKDPRVDELHITGSDRTYDAIVFGTDAAAAARKLRDDPVVTKPFSAELGNITPVIVVPGPWNEGDLAYHADSISSMLTNNAGFNCGAVRMVVNHAGWPLRPDLLDAIGHRLASTRPRRAYYPGAATRYDALLSTHPAALQFGQRDGDRLPWALIPSLDSATDDPCFATEAFCGLFGETGIEAPTVADYVERAVAFANERLWGTLSATLIVHPASVRDPNVAEAVERAIADLRAGTVSVNLWSALGFGLGTTTWGAFPGNLRTDIQSGSGVTHNALMFSKAQKSVMRAPFRVRPKPIWFSSHRTAPQLARELVRHEASPSVSRLPRILALALRG